ncbi:hypothetical protein N9D37_00720 [Erythrobacter sp.]|nr:hypothetical protein [Erythrobacter sp.]
MTPTKQTHSAELDPLHGELHFAVGGFWQLDEMLGFLDKLNEASLPLVKAREPIYALGDFTDFVPQDHATGDAIRNHLLGAIKFGLKQIAIIGASPLAMMQYRRLSEGLAVEFFDSRPAATAWLRADR